jgi:copper homeostasis protein
LVKLAGSVEVTFHRAFDRTPDLVRALEDVIACGCGRVLTSGGKPFAEEGKSTLAELVERARGHIRIAAGGGITVPIATSLLTHTRLDLHTSLRRRLVPDADIGRYIDTDREPPFELQVFDVRSLVAVMAKADE